MRAVVWAARGGSDCAAALRQVHERRGAADRGVRNAVSWTTARSSHPLRRQQHPRLSPLPVSIHVHGAK